MFKLARLPLKSAVAVPLPLPRSRIVRSFVPMVRSQRSYATPSMSEHATTAMNTSDKDQKSDNSHPSSHQQSTSTEGKHEWKTRAPYSIHEDGAGFEVKYEASCHCGKVTYQLSRDKPLDSKFCHCSTCQTQHASPFQWAAIFHKEDINFTNGHHNLEWYDPSSKSTEHSLPCKVRCNYCHSPIMDEGRNMILLFPSLIKLGDEGKKNFKPTCHMFYGQRVVDIPDGTPKWTGINNGPESELIADSPQSAIDELKKKREKERKEKEEAHAKGEKTEDEKKKEEKEKN